MSEKLLKCEITRYDKSIKEPPYLTIHLDEIEVIEPETDNLGEEVAFRMRFGCFSKGYSMKFYTSSDKKEYDFEIVVK